MQCECDVVDVFIVVVMMMVLGKLYTKHKIGRCIPNRIKSTARYYCVNNAYGVTIEDQWCCSFVCNILRDVKLMDFWLHKIGGRFSSLRLFWLFMPIFYKK